MSVLTAFGLAFLVYQLTFSAGHFGLPRPPTGGDRLMPWMQNEYGESYWVDDNSPPPPDLQPYQGDVPDDYVTPSPTPPSENYGSGAASNPQQPGDYGAPGPIPAPGAPGGPPGPNGPYNGRHDAPGGDVDYTDYSRDQPGPPPPGGGGGGGGGGAPADPMVTVIGADGIPRTIRASQQAAWQEAQNKQESVLAAQAARAREQQDTLNQQAQMKLDTEKAAQAANAAYQQSMVMYNNAQLAQAAARDAANQEIQRQQLEFQQQQAAAQIGVQREQAQNARRQQRPRRAAAVRFR